MILPTGEETYFTIFSIPQSDYISENWASTFFDGSNAGDVISVPYYTLVIMLITLVPKFIQI